MIEKLCKKQVLEFRPYVANQIDCDIKLDANESPFDLSDKNKEKIIDMIKEGNIINRYPDTESLKLRKEIAKKYDISYDNVIVGTGSDQIISVLGDAFIDKNDVVIAPDPSFGMYEISAKIHMAQYKAFKLDPYVNFEYDKEDIVKFARGNKAKILFLCTPNNPTGNNISNQDLEYIIRNLKETIVVVDEAYGEFADTCFDTKVLEYENAVVLKTFSKAYGLAGLRCGYSISSKKMADIIKRALPPYNISQMTQNIANIVMKDKEENKKRIEFIKSQRDRIAEIIRKIDGLKLYESNANYYLIKALGGQNLYDIFLKEGILIRKYSNNDALENCYRITVGSKSENDKVIRCLAKTFII